MPQSVQRLLIHSTDTIKALGDDVTLGEASEEGQEARNKDHLFAREHSTRKISRTITNEDQMHYMMITSDPVISALRSPNTQKKKSSIPKAVMDLLVASEPVQVDCSDDEEQSEVESEDEHMEDEEESLIEEESDDKIHLPDYYFANFEFGRCTLEEYE